MIRIVSRIVVLATLLNLAGLNRVNAGQTSYDFEQDPRELFFGLSGTTEDSVWSETGAWPGMGNPGGYLSVTEAEPSRSKIIVFETIDEGQLVYEFNLTADIRVGNGTSERPGDGFSIGFTRGPDPVLGGEFSLPGPPENGTSTGISVCFDSWRGETLTDGSGDLEGIVVVVDGEAVSKIRMPTRHGACEDTTSIQTGPLGSGVFEALRQSPSHLCWARLEINVTRRGILNVSWKGRKIVENYQSNFYPSSGHVFMAARNQRGNQMVHVDNIVLTTNGDIIPGMICHSGPRFEVRQDSLDLVFRGDCYRSVDVSEARLILDGEVVEEFNTFGAVGGPRQISISLLRPLPSGSKHVLEIILPGGIFEQLEFQAPVYATVPAEHAMEVPCTERGFQMRVLQSPVPIEANPGEREKLLAGDIKDAEGQVIANRVNPAGATSAGDTWDLTGFINFDRNANPAGVFRALGENSVLNMADELIPGIPGLDGQTDHITAEIMTIIEIPVRGIYTLAFNSDGGYRTTAGNVFDAEEAIVIGEFSGERSATTGFGSVFFEEGGFYQLRTLWYQGGSGASLEWWNADIDGNPIALLNDDFNGGLKTYRPLKNPMNTICLLRTTDGRIQLEFGGTLLSSETVDGAYKPVEGARSPYTVEMSAGQRFYISRQPEQGIRN